MWYLSGVFMCIVPAAKSCVLRVLCNNMIKSIVQTLWHFLCQTLPEQLCYSHKCYMLDITRDHCLDFFTVFSVRISVTSISFTACSSVLSNKFHRTSFLGSTHYCFHLLSHTLLLFYLITASCFTYIYLKSEVIINSVCLLKWQLVNQGLMKVEN
jgi:hypothetical protein